MTSKPDDLEPHLRYEQTARGVIIMPELYTSAHGAIHLSESTSDRGAFVWLRASAASTLANPHVDRHEVVLHVSLNDLEALAEQCRFLLNHHHNAKPRQNVATQYRKCGTPACFRQTTRLTPFCCYRCQVAHDAQCDVTSDHTTTCEERLAARGEWKIR